MTLKWEPPVDAAGIKPVEGYNVYRRLHYGTANWMKVGETTGILYGDAAPAGTFDYEVTAYNQAGEGLPTNIITVVVVL